MASRKHQIILEFVTVPYTIKHSGSSSAFGGSLAHLGTLQVEGSRDSSPESARESASGSVQPFSRSSSQGTPRSVLLSIRPDFLETF